jgi:hypothetical protein
MNIEYIYILLITLILIILYFKNSNNNIDNFNNISPQILNSLKPIPINNIADPKITNFLFSIQDFYVYNPLAFEELTDSLDNFRKASIQVYKNPELSTQYYQVAETQKSNALNALQSIIITLPPNNLFTNKLDLALYRLNEILSNYLLELYEKCKSYENIYGRDVLTREINRGPEPYNIYFDPLIINTNAYKHKYNGEFTYKLY